MLIPAGNGCPTRLLCKRRHPRKSQERQQEPDHYPSTGVLWYQTVYLKLNRISADRRAWL